MEEFDDQLLKRLRIALDEDGRKDQRICKDANIGPNYIRGIYNEGKKPSVEYLMKILDELGQSATIYVLTGMRLTNLDIEFLNLIPNMSERSKRHALALFQEMRDGEDA